MQMEGSGSSFYLRGRPSNDFIDYFSADLATNHVYINRNKMGTATYGNFLIPNGNVKIGGDITAPADKLEIWDGNVRIKRNGSGTLTDITESVSKAGILFQSSFPGSADNYLPGIFWANTNIQPDKPKAGIWAMQNGTGTNLFFGTTNTSTGISNTAMVVNNNGKVGIGTTCPDEKLTVNGKIKARYEVVVQETGGFCDYVFEETYKRPTYLEKDDWFKKNKRLYNMPSGKEIETNGLPLMTAVKSLTLNTEENSLDIIELYKMIKKLEKEKEELKKRLIELETK